MAQESALHADFRREGEHFREACGKFGLKTVFGCAAELFTDHPLHVAVGSIAPQNGFGFGGAFVTHYTPNESWRLSWNVDAVVSTNASWRGRRVHEDHPHAGGDDSTGRPEARRKAAHAGSPSLYGIQRLCAVDLAEQAEFLRAGKQFHGCGKVSVRHAGNDSRRERHQAGDGVAGHQQTQPVVAGRGERALCRSARESRQFHALDRDALYGGDRAGTHEPAGICATGSGRSHQAGYWGSTSN